VFDSDVQDALTLLISLLTIRMKHDLLSF